MESRYICEDIFGKAYPVFLFYFLSSFAKELLVDKFKRTILVNIKLCVMLLPFFFLIGP